MLRFSKWFGHQISKLFVGRYVDSLKKAFKHFVPFIMTINSKVFGSFMKDGIDCYMHGSLVIAIHENR